MNGVTLKEYVKFIAYAISGIAIITIAIIVIFDIFPAATSSKGYDAALAIAGAVMFWVMAGGIAWGLSHLIKKVRGSARHK